LKNNFWQPRAAVFHANVYLRARNCTRIVQSAQGPLSASDFAAREVFSTRFSTELLKTFTPHSSLVLFFACHLVRKLHRDFFSSCAPRKSFWFIFKPGRGPA
jgi:hypothetical protein